jgi:hypothetical protein
LRGFRLQCAGAAARPEQRYDDGDRGERHNRKRDPLRRREQEGDFEAPNRLRFGVTTGLRKVSTSLISIKWVRVEAG